LRSAVKDFLEEIALAERKLSTSRTKMFVMAITPEAWMGCSARWMCEHLALEIYFLGPSFWSPTRGRL